MRTLTDDEKHRHLLTLLKTAPRSLCPEPAALLEAVRDHPLYTRLTLVMPDPLPNHG